MAADPVALAPGQRLGGCRIEKLLARGAQGALFAATDEASGSLCALKVLQLARGSGADEVAEAARRFRREADSARRLNHPDIVHIHRAGEAAGQAYLVMDLLAGTDLVRYTQPRRRLPDALVLRLVERLARALAHAHAQGVVHRDIKPANVMVDWPADRVTLTDFGLARSADGEATRTGLVLGSPAYMAPEQLAGSPASAAADVYALGVLLYQLLTSTLPFDGSALGELLRRVAQEPAPDLRITRPDLPPALAGLVAALLAKAPNRRPASAQALADWLAAMRAGLPGPGDVGAKSRS